MSTVESFNYQLHRYNKLQFHKNRRVAEKLLEVQSWQIKRIKNTHHELFNQPGYKPLAAFLIKRLYSIDDMEILTSQLAKALHEKIKLEKFLPEAVRKSADQAARLAFLTLLLDEQVAIYCLEHNYTEINDEAVRIASLELNHFKLRRKQLNLLSNLGLEMQNFGRSILLYSAFRLAKRTAYRRGFAPLYDYLDESFRIMRDTTSPHLFFKAFTARELDIIWQVRCGNPFPFQTQPEVSIQA